MSGFAYGQRVRVVRGLMRGERGIAIAPYRVGTVRYWTVRFAIGDRAIQVAFLEPEEVS